jgi:hypothetical protein
LACISLPFWREPQPRSNQTPGPGGVPQGPSRPGAIHD